MLVQSRKVGNFSDHSKISCSSKQGFSDRGGPETQLAGMRQCDLEATELPSYRSSTASSSRPLALFLLSTCDMSESKGISLRTKRKGGRPTISAPQQISGPIPQSGGVPRSIGGKSSVDAPPPPSRPPQARPQINEKVSYLH
jgi:hypothetical protein